MTQSSKIVNKDHEKRRDSSISVDENMHSMLNGTSLPTQSFVDDIPFEFNQKYRTIIVSNIDIPEYDTNKIREILSKTIDFTLENKVLFEALEDLKRKKKKIQTDTLRQQIPAITDKTNYPSSNSSLISTNILSVNDLSSSSHRRISSTDTSIPVNNVPSARLPSVCDISWPSTNQEEHHILTPISLNQSSLNSVKPTDHSLSNCNSIYSNDLADTFDGRLTSNDPFNDAELKSLNDFTELNHLYSTNTFRR